MAKCGNTIDKPKAPVEGQQGKWYNKNKQRTDKKTEAPDEEKRDRKHPDGESDM